MSRALRTATAGLGKSENVELRVSNVGKAGGPPKLHSLRVFSFTFFTSTFALPQPFPSLPQSRFAARSDSGQTESRKKKSLSFILAIQNGIYRWVRPLDCTRMNIRLTMDKAGRVVIPKPLRDELHLEPGDALEMESSGEQITLRPVRGTGPLTKEHGVWVFRTGQPLAASVTDEMLRSDREERDLANLCQNE
jgi:AbrB family looped-hinge helix DNA binding protein